MPLCSEANKENWIQGSADVFRFNTLVLNFKRYFEFLLLACTCIRCNMQICHANTVELLLLPIEGTGEIFGNKTGFAIREVMRKIVHITAE